MRYFPGSMGFLIAMIATDEFRPSRDIMPPLYLCAYAHAMREQELFLALAGCLDANV